jgi:transposase InsO family protein
MQVTIRGWSRDHGPKELLSANLARDDVRQGEREYEWETTYIDVIRTAKVARGRSAFPINSRLVTVTGSADLNLNGGYMIQLELSDAEIARLFYLTHGAEEGRRALESLEEAARSLRALYGK